VNYIDRKILQEKDREDVDEKYNSFRIEATCRKLLKELISGF